MRQDPTVEKLRWLMLAAILADMGLTLSGQPVAFWSHPGSAIRGDGLGINDPTNHFFDFFLGYGWPAYLACGALYVAAVSLLVSVLPRRVALVLLFTVTLGHAYDGINWLAIRWHAGMLGSSIYGLGLGFPLALVVGRVARTGPGLSRRLAWIAAATLLVDFIVTLLGQPGSYWSQPGTAYEGNVVSRFFLVHGWEALAAYALVYASGLYLLIVALPRLAGLAVAFFSLIGSFAGASNWLFFVWRLGLPAVLVYACLVSVFLVVLAFEPEQKSGDQADTVH
jgi:hypothetical protein